MFKLFKSKKLKTVLASALSLILMFSLAIPAFADTPDENYVLAEPVKISADMPVRDFWYPPEMPENLNEMLEEVLTAVRLAIDIDDELYTNFNYDFYPGDGWFSLDQFYLSWRSDDWNSRMDASVTTDGKIQSFHKWEWTEERDRNRLSLAAISKDGAVKAADAFLKQVLGKEYGLFQLVDVSLRYPSERYYLYYNLSHNGFDHNNFGLYVEVDKITGEIAGFSRSTYPLHDISGDVFEYEDSSDPISREEALAAYLEHIGLTLTYVSHYDWQTRELEIRPVYQLANRWNQAISAVDGSLIYVDYNLRPDRPASESGGGAMDGDGNYGYNDSMPMATESEQSARSVRFSEAEREAIDGAANFITLEKAIEIIFKAFDVDIDVDEYDIWSNLSPNRINNKQYVWNVNISKYSRDYMSGEFYNMAVDARNGDVIGYSTYSFDYSMYYYGYYDYYDRGIVEEEENKEVEEYVEPEYAYTYKEAEALAIKKIKELLPKGVDFDKDFEATEDRWYGIMPLAESDDAEFEDFTSSHYYFHFTRKANGLLFNSNYVSIGINNITGKITEYNLSWYEDAKFPAVTNIVTAKTALDSIADFGGYDINYANNGYTEDGKILVSLLYGFGNSAMVDAFTGECIRWDFSLAVKYDDALPNYTDLDGHWSKDIVNTLADNGIYVWGGDTFDPDKAITRGEFMRFMRFYTSNPWAYSSIESSIFVNSNAVWRILESMDYGYDFEGADEVITKQEAMKIICELAGYGEIGKHHGIFNYMFNEDGADEEYWGYIAIMKALGVVQGDGNENFFAKDDLKRSEAAAIVYNIIMSFQSK